MKLLTLSILVLSHGAQAHEWHRVCLESYSCKPAEVVRNLLGDYTQIQRCAALNDADLKALNERLVTQVGTFEFLPGGTPVPRVIARHSDGGTTVESLDPDHVSLECGK